MAWPVAAFAAAPPQRQQQLVTSTRPMSPTHWRPTSSLRRRPTVRACVPSFVPAEWREIDEPAAVDVLRRMKRLPADAGEAAGISYAEFGDADDPAASTVALVHGFDSSMLEFRRLAPRLRGVRVLLIDLFGWGFTERDKRADYGAASKRSRLAAALEHLTEKHRPVVLGGASLGGAVAVDFAAFYPERVCGLVLVDAQAFIDGSPGKALVWPLDRLGISVLRTKWLRRLANRQSYYDVERFATEDAMLIGRLPCHMDGWFEANLSFLKSDGYRVSRRLADLRADVLLIWGRDDRILSFDNVKRFQQEIGPRLDLRVINQCGHVPHLEKPELCASMISEFVRTLGVGAERPRSAGMPLEL